MYCNFTATPTMKKEAKHTRNINGNERAREWNMYKYISTDIFRQHVNDFNGVVDTEWIFKSPANGF